MPTHDIIDNRNEKLVDHIKRILSSTERARFAVGYFFLSGLTAIADRGYYPLSGWQLTELRSVTAHRFGQERGTRFGVRSSPKPPAYTETTTTCDSAASLCFLPAFRTS